MRKLGKFIILIAIVWICWSAYGSTFQQTGITGVMEKVRTDVQDIKENQTIKKAIETINHDIQTLFARLMDKQNEGEETQSPSRKNLRYMHQQESRFQFIILK
ncbi:hypothetical protein [Paracerasibacillus soli]|uniref:Secreted protein n=1 Tax=Paracerasibacillus soli TaxID=480284 RepID=A0ABU5CRZ4_9BACI|nr:hypothetical protein [Virgibacillus soli]MDY0409143.1 hypothetical protein [Virgibacillus soli]